MNEYMILLRAVMPTGKNKVPMALLREALNQAGFENVRTYIQSGNVLALSKLKKADIEKKVHDLIAQQFGGDIAVVAIPTKDFRRIFDENPFQKKKPENVYFTFLTATPEKTKLQELAKLKCPPDEFQVTKQVIYHYCPGLYSKSKVNTAVFERKLGLQATTRVSRTVAKMLELSSDS